MFRNPTDLINRNIIMLLSASVERFFFSRVRDVFVLYGLA